MATTDTHSIVKALVASGVKEKEAEVLVSNFVSKSEFLELEKDRLGLATKHDLEVLKNEIIKSAIPFFFSIMGLLIGVIGLVIGLWFK